MSTSDNFPRSSRRRGKSFPKTIEDVEQWRDRPTRRSLVIIFVTTLLLAVAVPATLFPPAIQRAREFDELANPVQREIVHGEVSKIVLARGESGRGRSTRKKAVITLRDGSEVTHTCLRHVCFHPDEPVTVTRHRQNPEVFYVTSDVTGQSSRTVAHDDKIWNATGWTVAASLPLLFAVVIIGAEIRLRARIRKIELETYGVVDRV